MRNVSLSHRALQGKWGTAVLLATCVAWVMLQGCGATIDLLKSYEVSSVSAPSLSSIDVFQFEEGPEVNNEWHGHTFVPPPSEAISRNIVVALRNSGLSEDVTYQPRNGGGVAGLALKGTLAEFTWKKDCEGLHALGTIMPCIPCLAIPFTSSATSDSFPLNGRIRAKVQLLDGEQVAMEKEYEYVGMKKFDHWGGTEEEQDYMHLAISSIVVQIVEDVSATVRDVNK